RQEGPILREGQAEALVSFQPPQFLARPRVPEVDGPRHRRRGQDAADWRKSHRVRRMLALERGKVRQAGYFQQVDAVALSVVGSPLVWEGQPLAVGGEGHP